MITVWVRSIPLLVLLGCAGEATVSKTVSPPPTTPQLLLHTTLDGPSSVMAPAVGSGSGASIVTVPVNDFVAARTALGLRADAVNERILIPQTSGGVPNIELERGTLEFWYRPNYNNTEDHKYTIAGTGPWPGNGVIHIGKHNSSNQYSMFLIFYDANGARSEHNVAASAYSWRAGDWLLFRLTWDFSAPAGTQNVHFYINGSELPLTGQVTRGPQPVPAESSALLYIGSRDTEGPMGANGIYDDVKIWNAAIPPS